MLRNVVYPFLPTSLRYRYNKHFWKTYSLLKRSVHWNHQEILDYQWLSFKKLLNHAYRNTVYYPKKYAQYGINPSDIKNFDDIKKLPILTKKDIRKNLTDLIALPENKLEYVTTGGSTGKPLGFYLEKDVTYQKTLAFEWKYFNDGGYKFRDKIAILRGAKIPGVYKIDRRTNSLFLSTFNMSKNNIEEYLSIIKNFNPTFIRAYPSALKLFSNYLQELDIKFNEGKKLKAVFTSSELIKQSEIETLEQKLNCPIYDKYGNSEQCSILYKEKEIYKEFKLYSFSEFLNGEKKEVNNGLCSLFSTSFVNYATPFIRYQTNDLLHLSSGEITEIEGRRTNQKDHLTGKNHEQISLTALNTHTNIFDNVHQIQYHQTRIGHFSLILLPKKNFNDEDMQKIKKEFSSMLKKEVIEYDISIQEQPILTNAGKFKLLIKDLND